MPGDKKFYTRRNSDLPARFRVAGREMDDSEVISVHGRRRLRREKGRRRHHRLLPPSPQSPAGVTVDVLAKARLGAGPARLGLNAAQQARGSL